MSKGELCWQCCSEIRLVPPSNRSESVPLASFGLSTRSGSLELWLRGAPTDRSSPDDPPMFHRNRTHSVGFVEPGCKTDEVAEIDCRRGTPTLNPVDQSDSMSTAIRRISGACRYWIRSFGSAPLEKTLEVRSGLTLGAGMQVRTRNQSRSALSSS